MGHWWVTGYSEDKSKSFPCSLFLGDADFLMFCLVKSGFGDGLRSVLL